ncbi:MAG TPA: GNAT family N-acetyltransferase [Acidimicrobiales bacterium]
MTSPTVRSLRDDEFAAFLDVVRTAFLETSLPDESVEARRPHTDIERCLGAFDAGGRLCGVARSFPTPLTVPGGEVAAAAVSAVGVLPTHTRQGHLSRMMRHQLADAADRGEPVAALVAAEYPIYGRFGYGPATEAVTLHLDATAATWLDDPTGTVDIVDDDSYAKIVDDLYDRARRGIPGHIGVETARWQMLAGVLPLHESTDAARRQARKLVWRDAAGEPQAATAYAVDESWVHNRPANTLRSDLLVATSARAEHEMLRFLAGIDWIAEVRVALRPVDDPAPLALVNGRAARLAGRSDHTWVRVLDVPAALGARRYAVPGSMVLQVDDPLGHAHGRFRLEGGPGGAACTPTDDEPDLSLPVGALGAAYLGGQSWARLADAGWIDERRPGAIAVASAMFATPRAPWGAITF